jgi:hypothetical protein
MTSEQTEQITKAISSLDLTIRELVAALKASPLGTASAPQQTYQRAADFAPMDSFNGNWREHTMHFGKNAGIPLGKLAAKALAWYIQEYQPKPYNGRPPRESDLALRAALDAAAKETGGNMAPLQPAPAAAPTAETSEEVPF